MWPKVLAQLIDLLPHARRLMPLAENFFQNRGASATAAATLDPGTRQAMDDLRDELAKTAATQTSLYRQITAQSEAMADAASDARAAKAAVTAIEARLESLEQRQKTFAALAGSTLAGIVAVIALLIWMALRAR